MTAEQEGRPARFRTTRWSVVAAASAEGSAGLEGDGRAALESLCAAYWYPLYAFARRRGESHDAAQDLVQGFFAALLEKRYLADADRDRGRFRTFLITAFRNFASKERERARAQKRGGDLAHLSLDVETGDGRYALEPRDDLTPERVFERRWALTVIERALDRLREEAESAGRAELFGHLLPHVAGGAPVPTHAETAQALGMTAGAVKVAVHRLRRRYRDVLRAEIAETVSDPDHVDAELQHLIDAL